MSVQRETRENFRPGVYIFRLRGNETRVEVNESQLQSVLDRYLDCVASRGPSSPSCSLIWIGE